MPNHSPYASALSPEYALLGLLTQQPTHGYDLHQRLATDLGHVWHVSLSQVYNILTRLEERGFIAGMVHEQAKLPPRRQFRLTPAGRRHFEAWLHTPTGSSVRAIRVEFITRLYFARARNKRLAVDMIDSQAAETRASVERLQAILAELPFEQTFNRLGLELRIRQLASILDWLAECRTAIDLDTHCAS